MEVGTVQEKERGREREERGGLKVWSRAWSVLHK